MRTLASTFSNRDEAEAACRRLAAIGVARERIVVKDVAQTSDSSGGTAAAAAAGVFVSVKVTTDQVEPANEILKGSARIDDTPAPPVHAPARDATLGAASGSDSPARSPAGHVQEPGPAPLASAGKPQHRVDGAASAGLDRTRIGRYLALFCLAVLAAFLAGAGLGLLI